MLVLGSARLATLALRTALVRLLYQGADRRPMALITVVTLAQEPDLPVQPARQR